MHYLSLSLASFLIAILLWRIGRRGKRLDDHPTCRKCAYDLIGLLPDSTRCSECGADIKAKRAVRIGNRRRRPVLAWTGLVCIFLSLPASAFSAHNWWQHFNKWPWLPFSIVEREYKTGNWDAMRELELRLSHGKLSKAQASTLVRDMTAWQDDPSSPVFLYFDIMSTCRDDLLSAGVDPDLIEAYYDHPYRVDVKCHSQVPRGTFFPFRITFAIRPYPRSYIGKRNVEDPKASVQIGKFKIQLQSPAERPLSETAYDRDSMIVGTDAAEFWQQEHNARIEGTLLVEFDLDERGPLGRHVARSIPFSAEVVAPGAPTVTYVSNPTLDANMRASFDADSVAMQGQDRILLWRILPGFEFQVNKLPENIALDVYFEQASHKWPQGVLIRAAGTEPMEIYFTPRLGRQLPPDEPPRYFIGMPWRRGWNTLQSVPTDVSPNLPLELVLKSNPALAATHSGFDRVWQGEIRIPIPIKPSQW